MPENTLKPLSKLLGVPFKHSLEHSLSFDMFRPADQSPLLFPSALTCTNAFMDHPADMEWLDFHPGKGLVEVSRSLECARQDWTVSHHVFFHLKCETERDRVVRLIKCAWKDKLTSCFLMSCFHFSFSRFAAIMDPYRSSILCSLMSPWWARLNTSNH